MADIQPLLAKNIRKYRNLSGFSQILLAKKIGISKNYMSGIELGDKFPSAPVINRICDALSIQPFQLFLDNERITHDFIDVIDKQLRDSINREIDRIRDVYMGIL